MTENTASNSFGRMSATQVVEHFADPEVHSGGGTAAAMSGAIAAGTALLVMRLNRGNASNRDDLSEIDADIESVQSFIAKFFEAADQDATVLNRLMTIYRERRSHPAEYQQQLTDATTSAIALCELIASFLAILPRQIDLASRFTVSDLGAAAAMGRGALEAAGLTAQINISMLSALDQTRAEIILEYQTRHQVAIDQGTKSAEISMNATERRLK